MIDGTRGSWQVISSWENSARKVVLESICPKDECVATRGSSSF